MDFFGHYTFRALLALRCFFFVYHHTIYLYIYYLFVYLFFCFIFYFTPSWVSSTLSDISYCIMKVEMQWTAICKVFLGRWGCFQIILSLSISLSLSPSNSSNASFSMFFFFFALALYLFLSNKLVGYTTVLKFVIKWKVFIGLLRFPC